MSQLSTLGESVDDILPYLCEVRDRLERALEREEDRVYPRFEKCVRIERKIALIDQLQDARRLADCDKLLKPNTRLTGG